MEKVSILLVCAGGNSTSILVNDMQRHLRENEAWHIDADAVENLHNVIGKYDYILVAPQIQFRFSDIKQMAEEFGDIKVISNPSADFASCVGKRIINLVRKSMNSPSSEIERRSKQMSEVSKSNGLMEKISNWMMEKLVPVANKIGNQRHLASVRDGLTIIIPATIVGGFAILLAVPPVPATITEPSNVFYAFLLGWKSWASANAGILMTPYFLTIGIISLYAVCGVSYMLAARYKMNALNNMVSALLVFLTISGALDMATGTLNVSRLGAG